MMLSWRCTEDVVIDTNVLVHASNGALPQFGSSFEVVNWMMNCTAILVLDDLGKLKPDPSTSRLYCEYKQHVPRGSIGEQLLIRLLSSSRVKFVERPDRQISSRVRQICPRNKGDQAVLGAAAMSEDKVLVSNDWNDFDTAARDKAAKGLAVTCLDSDEAVA